MHRLAPALALLVGCGSSDAPVSPTSAVETQRFIDDVTAIALPRAPGTAHWQTVQDLCADRLEALGYTVELHAYGTGTNVIGRREGTTLPDEHVVISAHYDSVSQCAGADDNASGVAGTLEAARVLALAPHDRSLVVACWDEEEAGLIGSRAWVQQEAAGLSITASFVFEMIGYRSSEPGSQRTDPNLDAAYPDQTAAIAANEYRGDFILLIHDDLAATAVADFEATALTLGLPTIVLPVSDGLKKSTLASGLRRSDHAPFWDADIAAIQITDTANFRNPHYHCSSGPDAVADIDAAFATLNIQATVAAAAAALDR